MKKMKKSVIMLSAVVTWLVLLGTVENASAQLIQGTVVDIGGVTSDNYGPRPWSRITDGSGIVGQYG